jgi:Carboxypeptidase regulatory-like domain/TonB dependent receptor
MRFTRYFAGFLLLCPAWAQTVTGNITGQVEDATGALVPNAKVELVHSATKESRTVFTNERGEFLAPVLPIGQYDVSAEFQGFKRATLSGIVLAVDKTVSLTLRLEPGNMTESVEVTASAALVDASTSSLGQVIENKKVLDMPLNGRNVFALGLLSGNTTEVYGIGSNQTFAGGGGRFSGNAILLDGVADDTTANHGSIGRNSVLYTPSVDALEEFKVNTNSFSAEFGHSAGAVVSATIKSGTNNLHGTLFEFLRNDKLDANNFFANAARQPKAPFKQNQFGFALGGPIKLPKLYDGHNRTFFFIDYQGTRQRTSSSSTIYDLPPISFRTGDFSSLGTTIYDPHARQIGPTGAVISTPFPNNRIPTIDLNPTSLAVETLIPTPNFGPPNSPSRNYLRQPQQRLNGDQFDVRADQKISQGNNLFGRFSFGNTVQPSPGIFDNVAGGGTTNVTFGRHAVLNDVEVFGPGTINEARFGFSRSNGSVIGQGQAGADFARQNGLALTPFAVQGFPSMVFSPTGQISGSQEFSSFGGGASVLNFETTFEGIDNVTVVRGNHALKFGGDVRRIRYNFLNTDFGEDLFGSIFSSSSNNPGSGDPYADFLMGYPAVQNPFSLPMIDWARQRSLYAGLFAQDDWKVTPRLTLNLGLRYDLYTRPVDARDRGSLYNFSLEQFVQPGQNGYSRAIINGAHLDFSPRVGLAYRVTKKLVVRTAYGIFYGLRDQNEQTSVFAENPPNVALITNPTITAAGTLNPPVTINTPITLAPADPTMKAFSASNPLSYTIETLNFSNAKDPYLQQWNFTLQYELARSWLLQAAYAGAKGTKLDSRVNLGQVPFSYALVGQNIQANRGAPEVNGIQAISSSQANNKYESVNFKVEKQFSYGFNLLLNYTISKNLETNGSGDSSYVQNGNTTNPLYSFNLNRDNGPAPLDIPQRFVVSYGYELPFGQGKRFLNTKSPLNKVIGGWQVNGITTLRGGFPTDIRVGVVPPTFATFNVPNRVPGVDMYAHQGVDQYFNPAAFTVPGTVLSNTGVPIQLFGDSARHVARGPGGTNFDFSMFKNLRLKERATFQFRAEFFNISNTPTFFLASASSPETTVGKPTFGQLTSSNSVGRQIQFGMKLIF